MPDWSAWVRDRLPPLGLRPERELEIMEELALQCEEAHRAALLAGRSPAEARRLGERQIADWTSLAAEIRAAERPIASRLRAGPTAAFNPPVLGSSRGAPMSDLLQDLRYAFRMMARSRGLTAVMLLTTALGIGATTAIFALVDAFLVRPLPFHDAGRLVFLAETAPQGGRMSVAWPNYGDWAARAQSFESMAVSRSARFTLTGGDTAQILPGRAISAEFLSTLGVAPRLGRGFSAADDLPGAAPVALLGDGFWSRRFGRDPAAVGASLTLDGRPYTVVGVLPAGFQYRRAEDVFVPLGTSLGPTDDDRGNHRALFAVARLRPGVTVEEARAEMAAIGAALEVEHAATNSGNGTELLPLQEAFVETVRVPLLVLLAAVACVLLIGCANLASLLLARGAARQHEVAVRIGLGAERGRVMRQLLTESVLLAVLGGIAGLALAHQCLPLLLALMPADLARLEAVRLDSRAFLFAALASLATGLLFGTLPALKVSRAGLARAARLSARAGGAGLRTPLRRVLLAGEIGLAIVLLTTAGLMMRSVLALGRVDPGFEPERVLTLQLELRGERYRSAAIVVAQQQIVERVQALPGVENAALTHSLPFDGSNWSSVFIAADLAVPPRAELPSAAFNPVSPSYFDAIGARLLQGRPLDGSDGPDAARVVVINESMARRLWPGQSPLGKRIKQGWPEWSTPWREVVGVVADVKLDGVDRDTPMHAFVPLAQDPTSSLFLVVRTSQEPSRAGRSVTAAVQELDRDVPVYGVRPMSEVYADSIAPRRFSTFLLAPFSLAALALAALGIFGLMAYAVAQRTREIGVRMALGARAERVVRQILAEGLKTVAAGTVLGIAASLLVTRFLRSLLFGVEANDPAALAGAVAVLALASLAAAYLPARSAARIDPVIALRGE